MKILGEGEREVEGGFRTVKELMEHLNLSEEEYLPTVNGKVVVPTKHLEEDEEIVFVPVISGG